VNSSGHLSPELLFGYKHRLLSPDELRTVHDHLEVCETCRQELAGGMMADEMAGDIRSSFLVESRPANRYLSYVAAAAAILVVAGGSIWLSRHSLKQSLVRDRDGDDAPSVREALRAGRIALPAFLEQLASPRETLMGDASTATARLLSPKATGVLGPSVRFQWEPIAGRWTYKVRIYLIGGEPAVTSPDISGTEWMAAEGLAPGNDYQWQVVASHGAERVTLPQPPDAPPRFRVLDNATSSRLRGLASQHPEAHLFLGVEFGQAGAIDDARAELTLAVRQKTDGAQELFKSLGPQRP